jgi:hypothetical protein
LSILLMATIGLRPIFSALPTTNLVCGIGPSAASTSTMAPSTMLRMRSTSPPKSAWPGVSTMLMRVSFQTTEVALARMVMPRSLLEVVGVHHALGDALVFAEGAGLLQQLVDERGLAMVDVGDDGDVAQVHCGGRQLRSNTVNPATCGSAGRRSSFECCGAISRRTCRGNDGGVTGERRRRGRFSAPGRA